MKKREDNMDLLRIICTLMVVCNHLLTWTGLLEEHSVPMSPIWFAENVLFVFVLPAVNCFVLISGYYLCKAKFKLSKLVSLWIQSVFYSAGLYLLVCLIDAGTSFSIIDFIKSCMVITMERYWFITAYVLLYIVSPFLNYMIHAMNQKMHGMCCIILLVVFSVLPNLTYICDFSGVSGGYSFLWFVIMYVVAAYIRLYIPANVKHQRWMFPCAILCALMICAEKFLAYIVTPVIFGTVIMDSLFYSYNSIFAVPCALALFQGFRGVEIRSLSFGKIIRFFAPLSFAAYLIHAHPHFIKLLLNRLDVPAYAHSFIVFPYMAVATIGIVVASCLFEWLRCHLFAFLKIDTSMLRFSEIIQNRVIMWLNDGKE